MCTAHVLMRFCHLINHSFVCKAKEGRHARTSSKMLLLIFQNGLLNPSHISGFALQCDIALKKSICAKKITIILGYLLIKDINALMIYYFQLIP